MLYVYTSLAVTEFNWVDAMTNRFIKLYISAFETFVLLFRDVWTYQHAQRWLNKPAMIIIIHLNVYENILRTGEVVNYAVIVKQHCGHYKVCGVTKIQWNRKIIYSLQFPRIFVIWYISYVVYPVGYRVNTCMFKLLTSKWAWESILKKRRCHNKV